MAAEYTPDSFSVRHKRRLGFWLRMARERAGISQQQVAHELGWSPTSASGITQYEKGSRVPPFERLHQFAGLYEVPISLFLDPPPTGTEQIDFIVSHPETGYISMEAKMPPMSTDELRATQPDIRVITDALINLVRRMPDQGEDLVHQLNAAIRDTEEQRVRRLVSEAIASRDPGAALTKLVNDGVVTLQQLIDDDLVLVRTATDTTSVSDSISHSIGRAADR